MSEADELEAALRRSERRRRGVLIGIGVLGAAGALAFVVYGQRRAGGPGSRDPEPALTAAQQQQLVAAIAKSRETITAHDADWRAAIDGVEPHEVPAEAPACGALASSKRGLAASPQSSEFGSWELVDEPITRFNSGSMASLSRTPWPLGMSLAGTPPPAHSPHARFRLRELERLAAQLAEPSYHTFDERLRAATIDKLYANDVQLVIDNVREPELVAGTRDRYSGGAITARAWVYDHDSRRVVCAGVVRATSSPAVDTGVTNLNDDLLTNLVRAIPDGVREVP